MCRILEDACLIYLGKNGEVRRYMLRVVQRRRREEVVVVSVLSGSGKVVGVFLLGFTLCLW